jgi:hypothetical protein
MDVSTPAERIRQSRRQHGFRLGVSIEHEVVIIAASEPQLFVVVVVAPDSQGGVERRACASRSSSGRDERRIHRREPRRGRRRVVEMSPRARAGELKQLCVRLSGVGIGRREESMTIAPSG